jgi:hypothetical protein
MKTEIWINGLTNFFNIILLENKKNTIFRFSISHLIYTRFTQNYTVVMHER